MAKEIKITVSDVSNKGKQFGQAAEEVERLVREARAEMDGLKSRFTGRRADNIQKEWESYQPRLNQAVDALKRASQILTRAAQAFGSTDDSAL